MRRTRRSARAVRIVRHDGFHAAASAVRKRGCETEAEADVQPSEDDRRAAAAAVNRKRALEEWEANKKRWRDMGVPTGLPAKK